MIRLRFAPHLVEAARDSYNAALMKHPCGAVSPLRILPNGGREYSIQLPTIH